MQNADIVLDGVRVPESRRLQRADSFRTTAAVLRLTRTEVAWQAIGIAIGAYEAALDYARERIQFGKPIAAHQMVQDLLVRSLMNITASIALCTQAVCHAGPGRRGRRALRDGEGVRDGEDARDRRLVPRGPGGNGIVLDKGVARFFSDAEAIYSYEGTREVNTLIVRTGDHRAAAFV